MGADKLKITSSSSTHISDEILAVITAALAAVETRPGMKLVVSSFRRVEQNTPVWNMTGRLERLRRNLNS